MNDERGLRSITRNITLWRSLKALAVLSLLLVVFSVGADAYGIREAFVWARDRLLRLEWEGPSATPDHYRLEISKTSLLVEPVTTSLSYAYTKEPRFEIEMENDYSYAFRVQSVSPYGALSEFSDSSALFVYRDGESSGKPAETQPGEFSLAQNYPNPFNSQTGIVYHLPSDGGSSGTMVDLSVYNVLGQRVRTLVGETQTPGKHHIIWDGCDDAGRQVASGHYVYQLTAGGFKASKRLIYLK